MFFSVERTRLCGMVIKGDSTVLYRDTSHITNCYEYPVYGTDVCSDIIIIPIQLACVRYFRIETHNYLNLCEVEVYGSKCMFN